MLTRVGFGLVFLATNSVGCSGEPAVPNEPVSGEGASFEVAFEGSSLPFTVTSGRGGLRIGELGPRPEFEVGLAVAESEVPTGIAFPALGHPDVPQLARVGADDAIYAGRVPGAAVDVFLFPLSSPDVLDGEPGVGLSALRGPLDIELALVHEVYAPGYSRTSTEQAGGDADICWWGPLDPTTSVVTIAVDGEPHSATRPRARFAVFDMTGTPRWAALELVGWGSDGAVLQSVSIASMPPPDDTP
jgi:hypothetical protein